MTQIFGDYRSEPIESPEYLVIGFSPSSIPLKQRWRNNGLSADFLADYLATFFPVDDTPDNMGKRRAEIKGAVSYIANELLENAMKFNDEVSSYPISIKLQLHEDYLAFFVANSVSEAGSAKLQAFIQELSESDPQDLYMRQLERNAEHDSVSASGLGLLTMINDYMAKIGWKFEIVQETPKVVVVTTMVQLNI